MNRNDMNELIRATCLEVEKLSNTKGEEYSTNTDALSNFKRNAETLGVDAKLIWAIYFNKHIDAIMSYVKCGHVKSTESINGRILDAVTYLVLLRGLIQDSE